MWKKLTSNFKNFLKIERNLSDNTIINYLFDLEKLQTFLKKNQYDTNPLKINQSISKNFVYSISKE